MARVQINYPAPDQLPVAPAAPTAPMYPSQPTKDERFRLFGLVPFGPGANKPLYDQTDPAVRALYGLDDPNRGAASANGNTGIVTPAQQPAPQPRTPVSSYGVNDTGRTYPFAPNPTYANTPLLAKNGAPQYPAGSGSPSGQGSGASGGAFGGFLDALMGLLGKGNSRGGYEAALRDRPSDIQALVSMSRNGGPQGQNAGGFLGGMFDDKKG